MERMVQKNASKGNSPPPQKKMQVFLTYDYDNITHRPRVLPKPRIA